MRKILAASLAAMMVLAVFAALVPVANAATISLKVGDYLTLGEYEGEAILWRCVDVDTNGPLMLADKVLCQKPFDVPGSDISGSHGRGCVENDIIGADRQALGSNYWGDSNMRCWLNSTAEAGKVEWPCGNAPVAVSGYDNSEKYAYNKEAGFLSGFSDAERAMMKTVSQKQLLCAYEYSDDNTPESGCHTYVIDISNCVQNYKTAYSETKKDKVFLLDVNQINRVYKKRATLGDDYYIARSADGGKTFSWLRTPYARVGDNFVRFVDTDGKVKDSTACYPYGGVRPAFYIDTEGVSFGGYGSQKRPYFVGENPYEDITVKIGDYLTMGSYEGKELTWRCVLIDKNGPLMLSDEIFEGMEFDAAGSNVKNGGSHDRSDTFTLRSSDGDKVTFVSRHEAGSNYWGDSNLRCWLSSKASAGNVKWTCGNPPSYKDKAGFLSDFSENELYAIKEVKLKTVLDAQEYHPGTKEQNAFKSTYYKPTLEKLYASVAKDYDGFYSETLTETMFIPDLQQIYNAYNNEDLIDDGYTKSTKDFWYWLRTANAGGQRGGGTILLGMGEAGNVSISEEACTQKSGAVRPSFYLNVGELLFDGKGTAKSPYKIDAMKKVEPTPEKTPEETPVPSESPEVNPTQTPEINPTHAPDSTELPEPTPDGEQLYASVFASGNVPFILCTTALLMLTVVFGMIWHKKAPYSCKL